MVSFKAQLRVVLSLMNLSFGDLSFSYQKLIVKSANHLGLKNKSGLGIIFFVFLPTNSYIHKLFVMVFAILEFSPYRSRVFLKKKPVSWSIEMFLFLVRPTMRILKRLTQ